MRVCIIGSKGQLAHECIRAFGADEIVAGFDLPEIDIADAASVSRCLKRATFDVLLNCAAFTQVDACETQREAAHRVNTVGPSVLGAVARDRGALLVHISTDYVFDGAQPVGTSYTEDDLPAPVTQYGATKFDGERAVAASGCRYAILRTAWLYGEHGLNFPKAILRHALAGPKRDGLGSSPVVAPLRVVNDQYGSPTWAYRLALQIHRVVEAGGEGVYHATAEGSCTWFDFAVHFLRCMGIDREVEACTTEECPRPARRPRNSVLENRRLKLANMNVMVDWRADVEAFVRKSGAALRVEAGGLVDIAT
jgi:dTDP-4-dehydrorhamnose reductase